VQTVRWERIGSKVVSLHHTDFCIGAEQNPENKTNYIVFVRMKRTLDRRITESCVLISEEMVIALAPVKGLE